MLRSNFPYQHLRPLFMIEYFRWEAMPEKCKDEFWEQKNVFYIIKALSKTGDHKNFWGRPRSNGLCWAMGLWSGSQRAAAGMAGRGWAGLGHWVDGARKKWHSLVCAFSPLGHLAAWILIKMVLMLVPWVRRARRRPPTPGFHTMFSYHSACGRSFCERNITDLAFKDFKKVQICCKIYSLYSVFSFYLLENLGRRQRKSFPYSSETFLTYLCISVRTTLL